MDNDTPLVIEKSAIWPEVKKIINNTKAENLYSYTALLHIEGFDINVIKILAIDTVKDYVNNIGDHIVIEFQFSLGDYIKKLYPYRNNIELSIRTKDNTSHIKEADKKNTIERYKAVFLQNSNRAVSGTEMERNSYEALNNELVVVKLQLLDTSLEILRLVTASGIFSNYTQEDIIRSILVKNSNNYKTSGLPVIDGIDIVKPDNIFKSKHTIIPDGVLIHDLPSYLQIKMGGVYLHSIGTYLQSYNNKKLWFVYPLFNINRFSENVNKLIFYSIPSNRLPGSDRTYYTEDKITHILLTSTKNYYDNADVNYMNDGVGFRSADAFPFMRKPVEMTEEGPVGIKVKLNNEIGVTKRKDNNNNAPVSQRANSSSDKGISSNTFVEFSLVSSRGLARVDLVWENCNPSLLIPGMPCKYVYLVGNKLVELKGIVLFAHIFTSILGTGGTATSYRTQAAITITVETYKEIPNKPKVRSPGVY